MKLTWGVRWEVGWKKKETTREWGERRSQLHWRLLLVMVVVFAAGRRHHSHGDAVCVGRRIAVICLRESGAGGVSKLHLSGDDAW
jgi:hypothetical protein